MLGTPEYRTSEIGLLRGDFEEILNCFVDWQANNFSKFGWHLTRRDFHSDLHESQQMLLPRVSAPITRHLFVQTKTNWVAYFDNWRNGTDAAPVAAVLSERLKIETIRLVSTDEQGAEASTPIFLSTKAAYPAQIFEYYNCGRPSSRILFSANDGGKWKHFSNGLLDVSKEDIVGAVDKNHPITRNRLKLIIGMFDAYPFSSDWYRPDCSLIEKTQ